MPRRPDRSRFDSRDRSRFGTRRHRRPRSLRWTDSRPQCASRQRMKQVAEREGFEPSMSCPIHAFQACSFDRSDTSPRRPDGGWRSHPALTRHSPWPLPLLPSGPGGVHDFGAAGGPDRTAMVRPSGCPILARMLAQDAGFEVMARTGLRCSRLDQSALVI